MSAMILSISLKRPLAAAIAATLGLGLMPQIAAAEPMHGIAMIGEPALPADFDHLPYANPDAPKGGKITYGVVGTFDSLNPDDRAGRLHLGARPVRSGLRQARVRDRCSSAAPTSPSPSTA